MDASPVVGVLEKEGVAAPVGPAGHTVVLVPAKTEGGFVHVPANGYVANYIVFINHQRLTPARQGGLTQKEPEDPPVAVRFDRNHATERIDHLKKTAVRSIAKTDLCLALSHSMEGSRVA